MPRRVPLTDRDVRRALLAQVLVEHQSDQDTLIVQEFGLDHGSCRVDVCVINGSFHGYELKSEADTLARLPRQVELYGRCLDRSTVVTAPGHFAEVKAIVPKWWGIKIAAPADNNEIRIIDVRAATRNPTHSRIDVARLLWRDEAELLLLSLGAPSQILRGNRHVLYACLAENIPISTLRRFVREMVKSRGKWRRHESRE